MRLPKYTFWILIAASSAAFAHGDLEHHWAAPEYIGEIHLQVAAMAALGLLWGVFRMVTRFRRSRRCG